MTYSDVKFGQCGGFTIAPSTPQRERERCANACDNRAGNMEHLIRNRLKRPLKKIEIAYIRYLRRTARQNRRAIERNSH